MRVLVVDDDPSGRYLVKSIVVSRGHEALEAGDGEEALRVAHEKRPDIVITDILMPTMDGYQLCRAWKSDPELAAVPLVFYTASYTDPADERFATSLGADGFWRKPTDPDVLLAAIEELVGISDEGATRQPQMTDETEILQEYSSRLVNKLEEKAASLEKANSELRRAMEILGEEVAIKAGLIAELNADVLERKRVEGELRNERDFTRQVIEYSDVFVAVLDPQLKVIIFSHGAERVTGYSADEVVGKGYAELFIPPEEREQRLERVKKMAVSGVEAQHYEASLLAKSGKRVLLQFSTSVTRDADEVVAYHIFAIDVTARCLTESVDHIGNVMDRALLTPKTRGEIIRLVCDESAERFGLPVVFVGTKRDDGTVTYETSENGRQYLAVEPVCWDTPEVIYPSAQAIISGKSVFREVGDEEGDIWAKHSVSHGLTSAFAVPLVVDGEVTGAMVFCASDRLLLDDDMRSMLERLAGRVAVSLTVLEGRDRIQLQSAALESAADGIAITDAEQRIQWVNPAFSELSGYSADEAVGMSMRAMSPDDETYDRLCSLMDSAHKGAPEHLDAVGVRKGGSRFFETVSVTTVANSDPGVERFVWLVQDVTERLQLEQLKSSFVATVSHELRTPLTSIIGFTDLLVHMEVEQLSQRGPELLRKVRGHSVHMKQLVEELLEVSMMQSEGLRLLKRPNDLEQVVRVHADTVERTPEHRLSIDVTDDLPMCVCDAERLGRAVANLVSNAVKYSPDGGPVDVSVRKQGDEAVISVSDRGVGLAPEDVPRLFDRFTQGDMSSTRSFGGIGLGLFVADQIVKAHGGRIDVESRLGEGSTFTIRIPFAGVE
ncbi:MAG: PAS domain S-box protein [Coriobacteriia bacterium]|nr:PAS domain S-box protein [Coriobacteriia bacterium]